MRQYCWRKSRRQPRRIHLMKDATSSPSHFLTLLHSWHFSSSSLGLGNGKSNAALCCIKARVGSFLACLPAMISFQENRVVGVVHQSWNHYLPIGFSMLVTTLFATSMSSIVCSHDSVAGFVGFAAWASELALTLHGLWSLQQFGKSNARLFAKRCVRRKCMSACICNIK